VFSGIFWVHSRALAPEGTIGVTVQVGMRLLVGPRPTVTGTTIRQAIGGQSAYVVVIEGTGFFSGRTTVSWNSGAGIPPTSTTVLDDRHMRLVVPASDLPTPGAMSFTVSNGPDLTSTWTQTVGEAPPELALLAPSWSPVGSAALKLHLRGENFRQGATIDWNGLPLSAEFASPQQLTATVPADYLSTAGTALVAVVNPSGHRSIARPYRVSRLQQVKLVAPDRADNDRFGAAVAAGPDLVVVGAPGADLNSGGDEGAVYVYGRSTGDWVLQQKLTASDGTSGASFGAALALDDDTLIVGAPNDGGGRGAAYVFTRTGATWSPQDKLVFPDGVVVDRAGSSVALRGDTVVLGAPGRGGDASPGPGAALGFTRSGVTWTPTAELSWREARPATSAGVRWRSTRARSSWPATPRQPPAIRPGARSTCFP
jgi:hypothetical protein